MARDDGSRCGHCGTPIRWYQNIPLLSFALLRGRCGNCRQSIGWRYPAVELATGLLFALCAWRWGLSPQAALWAAFCALLVCQFMIDLDTQLLPDSLNYVLLWLGLLGAAVGWTSVPVSSALWGAALGYDAVMLIADAATRAGSLDRTAIKDAIAQTKDFAGVTGQITIDEHHNARKPAVILKVEVKDGKTTFPLVTTIAP